MNKTDDVLSISRLTALPDRAVGPLLVSPARRIVQGPGGSHPLQPQVMLVLLCLAEREGDVVTRRTLFDRCWGGVPVGDDSLNRAITRLRQTLEAAGAGEVKLETVPATGYRLAVPQRENPDEWLGAAVEAAFDRWRLGLPRPDSEEIDALTRALAIVPGTANDWGVLALLLRKAAEYADTADCSDYVQRCELAIRKALSADPTDPNARVARAGLTPLFGNWSAVRSELTEILDHSPGHAPARHDMIFLEMATGRPSAALPMTEQLLAQDPFAATYHYKAMYQLWTMDRLADAEQVAARAMGLWPRHPAIWMARFWALTCTGRARSALQLIADEGCRPAFPRALLAFLEETAAIRANCDAGEIADDALSAHKAKALQSASIGPANAVASLQALCALDAVDEAFEVARGYYLGQGSAAVPLRWNADNPSITDQYRRVTQPLFIPSARRLREDPRFVRLCDDIGLTRYWDRHAMVPDFLT